MKKTLPILALTIVAVFGLSQSGFTNAGGAPAGRSGSPASNGNTCQSSGCHSGPSQTTETISISTDIPSSGFEPNTDYTITISGNAGGGVGSRIGFSASVEDASGNMQGTLSSSAGINVFSNFATHSSSSVGATNGTNSWDVNWNSGSAVDGTTIYVAMNFANGNGSTSGDVITTSSLALTKASGVSIDENLISDVSVYPIPATDYINVDFSLNQFSEVKYHMLSLDGKVVSEEIKENYGTGSHTLYVPLSELSTGVYLLHLQAGENVYTERFTVR